LEIIARLREKYVGGEGGGDDMYLVALVSPVVWAAASIFVSLLLSLMYTQIRSSNKKSNQINNFLLKFLGSPWHKFLW
jgi:hypothetical protein